jgi:hypothetical protein
LDNSGGDTPPKMSRWDRLRFAMVKPGTEPRPKAPEDDMSPEELKATVKKADDRERLIGLLAAPLAAAIAFIVSDHQIDTARALGQNVSSFEEVEIVLLVASVAMMAFALWRKRLFLGVVMAVYGLSIFDLGRGYWEFAFPFVLAGAWMFVRGFRLQQKLKLVDPGPSGTGSQRSGLPRPSKRYTPPTAPRRRPRLPKADKEQQAG